MKFADYLFRAFVGTIIAGCAILLFYMVGSLINGATLEPTHISRTYSTREIENANGYILEVGGDRYYMDTHPYQIFWSSSVKPEKFFQVSTREGLMGWELFKVEEVARNKIRRLVKAK